MGYEVKAPEWAKKYPALGNFVLMFSLITLVVTAIVVAIGVLIGVISLLYGFLGGWSIPVFIVLVFACAMSFAAAKDDVFGLDRK